MQKQKSKVDMGKALDADLVVTESNEIESRKKYTSSGLGNDIDADNADIKPVYDKEPMVEDAEQCQVTSPLLNPSLNNKTTEFSNQSLESKNICLKKTRVQTTDHNDSLIAQMNKKSINNADLKAQLQEKVFVIAALKNELRKLKGNSVDTKFAKPSILGKPTLQLVRSQSVVRQPNAFKSERPKISKPRLMMDDPNITMEEYIKLQAEKVQRHGRMFNWETATYDMKPLPPRAQRYLWLRYQVHVLDFAGLTEEIGETLTDRIRMVYTGEEGQVLFTSHAWRRLYEIRGPLVREFILEFSSTCRIRLHITEEMAKVGFEAYWSGSARAIPDKRDLRDYWTQISSDRDFLGAAPSYTFIRDPVRRLYHRLISYSISGKGQAPEKGRKSRARMFGGHFIGCLAEHFGLVSDDGLMGLSMIAYVLPVIDLDELVKLKICVKLGDTWAGVAPGLERQPIAAAGALEVTKGALDVDEGAQAIPGLVQAPQPPPATNKTMTQRLSRLEEEVHNLRGDIGEQRE
ncbi:hypothetical protein Tco_0321763, partial [Tanacetum coccineum]